MKLIDDQEHSLESVLDVNGLLQDSWTLSKPLFGEEGQVEILGWTGITKLDCKLLTKEELWDGYTETTTVLNVNKITDIYEKHGGVLVCPKN